MANLSRYLQKIFGSAASTGRMSEFGSLQTGSPATYSGTTITPDIVQTLSNYSAGMDGAVIQNASPALQDHNSLFYLFSYQLAYLTQKGIPEYLATQTYYTNDLCQSGGIIYQSLINTNLNNTPASTVGVDWSPISLGNAKNWLINSNFDFWQRSTIVNLSGQAYVADRWYGNASTLGGSGRVGISQISGGATGASTYSMKVVSFNSSAAAGSVEAYQMLENADSIQFTNQNASFSAQIKANNNVTQVGVTFVYETTEVKSTGSNLIGSEQLFTVNSSGYTLCTIAGQAMGNAFGANGVIGIRIRPTAVSSGNVWSVNNGFIISQVQLNLGSAPGVYRRNGQSIGEELELCQRYYEMSYALGTVPGTSSSAANSKEFQASTTTTYYQADFHVTKRTSPTLTNYSPNSGTSGKAYDSTAAADITVAIDTTAGTNGFTEVIATTTAGHVFRVHWTADAEI